MLFLIRYLKFTPFYLNFSLGLSRFYLVDIILGLQNAINIWSNPASDRYLLKLLKCIGYYSNYSNMIDICSNFSNSLGFHGYFSNVMDICLKFANEINICPNFSTMFPQTWPMPLTNNFARISTPLQVFLLCLPWWKRSEWFLLKLNIFDNGLITYWKKQL